MLGGPPKAEGAEYHETERPNYSGLFEERIERLAPLPEHRTMEIAEKFGLDKIGLYPVKFVASVLYAPPPKRGS